MARIPLIYAEQKRADERTRTADLLITSELLYLLSYVGLFRARIIPQARKSVIRTLYGPPLLPSRLRPAAVTG